MPIGSKVGSMSALFRVVQLLLALLLGTSGVAHGQEFELRHDLRVDIPVTAAAATGWITTELLKAQLAASACRWCDVEPGRPDGVNALDAAVRTGLRWPNPDAGDTASGVTAFLLAPLSALGLVALAEWQGRALSRFPIDALLIVEAAVIASAVNQAVKFAVGRERPFVHALPQDQKPLTATPADNNTSFYSGHTNLAFALATASGTIASLRGYKWAPWVWAVGLTIATATGYLRIAGDRHYFTDALTPLLFHARVEGTKTPSLGGGALPGGALLTATWLL
jgi:hypothetical protein